MKFYHLTTLKALPSILENGLNPNESESSLDAIFLTDNKSIAEDYIAMRNEDCVLLKIKINPDKYELGPDNYELKDFLNSLSEEDLLENGLEEGDTWKDCSWEQSLSMCSQIACYTPILPEHITIIKQINIPKQKIKNKKI